MKQMLDGVRLERRTGVYGSTPPPKMSALSELKGGEQMSSANPASPQPIAAHPCQEPSALSPGLGGPSAHAGGWARPQLPAAAALRWGRRDCNTGPLGCLRCTVNQDDPSKGYPSPVCERHDPGWRARRADAASAGTVEGNGAAQCHWTRGRQFIVLVTNH